MAAVPEEIPVALSSFMPLGAWQMSKLGIISQQPRIIENLGSVNVICLDKTGTITENQMTVKSIRY
jgi:Ca2+-transporting ATPase